MRFELTTPTLARLCSTPELRPHHRMAAKAVRRVMHQDVRFGKWDIRPISNAIVILSDATSEPLGRARLVLAFS